MPRHPRFPPASPHDHLGLLSLLLPTCRTKSQLWTFQTTNILVLQLQIPMMRFLDLYLGNIATPTLLQILSHLISFMPILSSTARMDIDDVQAGLLVSDPLDQDDVQLGMYQGVTTGSAEEIPFETLRSQKIRLSRLRRYHEMNHEIKAQGLLTGRTAIDVDPEYIIKTSSGDVLCDMADNYLDYVCTVGNSIGLWAAIPNVAHDFTFVFTLDLSLPIREFPTKHGQIGFDTSGRMLFIGKSRSEDVFLALAPKTFIAGLDKECPAGSSSGDTRLSKAHYRCVAMAFAKGLSKLNNRGFTCVQPYQIELGGTNPMFANHTNILYVP